MISLQNQNKYDVNQPEHIYYSADMLNSNSTGDASPQPLIFNESRNSHIINCAENYNVSIMRFSFDSPLLPIFIPQIQVLQNDINKTVYSITLSYKNFSATTFIQYIPSDMTQPIPNSPYDQVDYSSEYYYMFSYQKWISFVNNTFATCFNSLNALVIAGGQVLPSLNVPFMEIDPINLTCILNCDILSFNSTLINPINIYFNTAMYTIFTFFQYTRYGSGNLNGKNYLLNINAYNNTSLMLNSAGTSYTTIQVYQDGSSCSLMNPVESIVVTTNMPIVGEIVAQPLVYGSSGSNHLQSGIPMIAPILNDCQIPFTALNNYRPNVNYQVVSEYRLVNLYGSNAISQIQMNFYWRDKFNNLHQIYLGSNCGASIKLLFRLKQ